MGKRNSGRWNSGWEMDGGMGRWVEERERVEKWIEGRVEEINEG